MAEEMTNDEQLNIELSEEVAEGIYSNLAIITHSDAEFVIDFIKMLPVFRRQKLKQGLSLLLLMPRDY